MEQSIYIRSTGVTVVDVLKSLSRGYTSEQILKKHDELSMVDILVTLQLATNLIEQHVTSEGTIKIEGAINLIAKQSRILNVSKLRQAHPRAYEPWTTDETNSLNVMFRQGVCIKDISEKIGRGEGAIRSRLEKIGLIKPQHTSRNGPLIIPE